ncbi:MAG: hypothetical protein ACYDIC_13140 [Desulfobaccales bacterium]
MNADVKNKAAGALKTLGAYTKIFTCNILRRALILGRYSLICAQQQRLRRAQRRLGGKVLQALEQGEVNPMLTEAVKDALAKAKAIKAGKDKHYQAIHGLREKIRTACACELGIKDQ